MDAKGNATAWDEPLPEALDPTLERKPWKRVEKGYVPKPGESVFWVGRDNDEKPTERPTGASLTPRLSHF